jgi:hypothetical protein
MSYTATNFYNDELDRLQSKHKNANDILQSNERLAQLNDSYRKRYAKYVQMLMVVILAFIGYLAIVLLQRQFPLIPQVVVDLIVMIIIFATLFYLFSAFNELYSRSLMNYDELEIPSYDASGVDVVALASKGQLFGYNGNVMCVGDQCCPKSYDYGNNICMSTTITSIPINTTPKQQSFTTLEYEKIDVAYTNLPFNSNSLKRGPNSQNVKPLQDGSVLTYSNF